MRLVYMIPEYTFDKYSRILKNAYIAIPIDPKLQKELEWKYMGNNLEGIVAFIFHAVPTCSQ